MVNGVGRVHKIGKYNRQWSIFTNRLLNKNLPNSNSNYKYNENIDVGSKEPITKETYSRPSNDENDTFYLFLAYFIHLVVENNRIFEPLYPLNFGIIIYDVFGGVYGMAWYCLNSILITPPHNRELGNGGKYMK